MPTPFVALARLSLDLKRTAGRLSSMEQIGAFLRTLAPDEVRPALLLLLGRARPKGDPRKLEVSGATLWRAVRDLAPSAPRAGEREEDAGTAARARLSADEGHVFPPAPTLTIAEVHVALLAISEIAGKGAAAARQARVRDLLAQATPDEVEVLVRIILGDMRHGADEGVVLEALARMLDVPRARISRAQMLVGDVSRVAEIALVEGVDALERVGVEYFRPLSPMLAQKAENVAEALQTCGGRASLEHKLDGARLQVHMRDGEVRLFTRRLSEVTDSLPDVVAAVRAALPLREAIAEGEVVPVDAQGRPLPFQDLMRRFRRVHDVGQQEIGARLYLFDLLAADGEVLLDLAEQERWARLEHALVASPSVVLVPRLVTDDAAAGTAFYDDAVARGYEGVMAKDLASPYTPGVRGRAWLKVKKVHTLDVVVVAADWGYGRRRRWLSNYHLAVAGDDGGLVEVGKTFKGLTDAEFEVMTARLLDLREGPLEGPTVRVRPSVVLEVAYSDVQRSPQYAGGFALRFARVVRIRDDKTMDGIDTLRTVADQFERQQGAAF